MVQADRDVLQQPLFKKYNLNTFTNQQLIDDIHGYTNTLIEGTTELNSIEENIKKRADDKKKKKPAGKNAPKPKRKTQAQKREEAREKQAKEKKDEPGQTVLFDENSSRLDEKKEEKPKAEPEPLKTAIEKAEGESRGR